MYQIIDTNRMNLLRAPHPAFVLHADDRQYLEKVTPDQRKLILLLHDEKMSYDAIAKQTELAIGTVKSRINRGRQTIIALRAKAALVDKVMQEPTMRAVLPQAVT